MLALIKQNKLIEAVVFVRDQLKLGLKESKDIVDKYRFKNKEEIAQVAGLLEIDNHKLPPLK